MGLCSLTVRVRTTTVLLAVAAAAVGCSATGANGNEAAGTCNSPGVTADEVKIGLVFTDSGTGSSSFASARSGVDARIGLANEEGGINGRRIVYEWRDDANSTSQNSRVTDELVQRENVFGLLGESSSFGGSLESLSTQNVPVVGIAQASWARYKNVFSELYEPAPETIGRYIRESGGSRVGVLITGASAFALEVIPRYTEAFGRVGLTSTDTISYARGSDSPARIVQKLATAGADSIVAFMTPQDLADIMPAVRAADLSLTSTLSLGGYDRGLLPTLGPALAGVSVPVFFLPFEAGGPAIARYTDAMARFAPQALIPEQQFAMRAYIHMDIFLRGLQLAGDCPTRAGFLSALRQVPDYDADGLIAPTDLGNNANVRLDCYGFVQVNQPGNAFQVIRERLCADGTTH